MQQPSPPVSDEAALPALGIERLERRFAFVHACWHENIVLRAREGFLTEMQRLGVTGDLIDIFAVPGAFELPLHAKKLAQSRSYDAIVACALVVDLGIYRHDFIADAVVNGLMSVQLETEIPVLSVVLTPHHFQAQDEHLEFFGAHFVRKGAEAASACVQTVNALRRLADPALRTGSADKGGGRGPIQ